MQIVQNSLFTLYYSNSYSDRLPGVFLDGFKARLHIPLKPPFLYPLQMGSI